MTEKKIKAANSDSLEEEERFIIRQTHLFNQNKLFFLTDDELLQTYNMFKDRNECWLWKGFYYVRIIYIWPFLWFKATVRALKAAYK